MNTSDVDNKTLVLVGGYERFGEIYFFCLQGGVILLWWGKVRKC